MHEGECKWKTIQKPGNPHVCGAVLNSTEKKIWSKKKKKVNFAWIVAILIIINDNSRLPDLG